jgi:hypothetical protein
VSRKLEQGDGAGPNVPGDLADNYEGPGSPADLYERLGVLIDNQQWDQATDMARELWFACGNLRAETAHGAVTNGHAVEGPHHVQSEQLMARLAEMSAYLRFYRGVA